MFTYVIKYYDKLLGALAEHLLLVFLTLVFSLILAAALTVLCVCVKRVEAALIGACSMIYSIPSIALFAMLIPLTGLGKTTAVIVLTLYNQYLLLRNFLTGLHEVDRGITEAAAGMGMTTGQTLVYVQLPLAKEAIFSGIRLAAVSTVGIATIAASVNAGGLGSILFDGLRTMNMSKILWGSILSAGLALVLDRALSAAGRRF
ncbi:MAG: ABC transporter permease [Roseburia sp.]|jgi:osmoprotectant transport system permease protein|nr:ABC transporter permease [Roseburia sp.]